MCNCNSPKTVHDAGPLGLPIGIPEIPIAGPLETVGLTPDPEGPPIAGPPIPWPGGEIPNISEFPVFERPKIPEWPIRRCKQNFPNGCWMLTLTPSTFGRELIGTLRVDRGAPGSGPDGLIVSGDLYRRPLVLDPKVFGTEITGIATKATSAIEAIKGSRLEWFRKRRIPIYPRNQYHSYLKGIRLSVPTITFGSGCSVTIDVEQFDYTHPPAGQFQGSFPASASRTLRMQVDLGTDPLSPWSNSPAYFGTYSEGGVQKGSVSLIWVSSFMRRAVLEIDTLAGATTPQPVPNAAGTGNDWFDTLFAQAGWQLTVEVDQSNVAVPAGVNANQCWSSANLHALMLSVRKPTTNLDTEWRTHLVVVPATMGCSRGVMYDQIAVPREGSASFSNDGYPTSHSSNFGTAANQQQRNVPRAYLRSAAHEVTHAFNQIHQESETSADNSIMTTTPSVADVLGGPVTGAPGVFPDQINIGFNTTVRNHLAHMPDPVVRPGGWPFASWFGGTSPQAADRAEIDASDLSLEVNVDPPRPALGEPVLVTWTLTNRTGSDLVVPNDVSLQGTFATMEVTDANGQVRPVRAFEIACDDVALRPLAPGASLTSQYRAFWSTAGFAFERPGRYEIEVTVAWSAGGLPVAAGGSVELFVDHPLTDADNSAAALALHPEVGMWVALDGAADHLTEAVDRVSRLMARPTREAVADGAAPSAAQSRVGRAFAALAQGSGTADGGAVADATTPRARAATRAPAKKVPAKKSGAAKRGGR